MSDNKNKTVQVSNQKREKDFFLELCLTKDKVWKVIKKYRRTGFTGQRAKQLYNEVFCVSGKCRHCNQEITKEDFAIYHTYWKAVWTPCHKKCLNDLTKQEAYDCQCIDANCNDCGYFVRGQDKTRETGYDHFEIDKDGNKVRIKTLQITSNGKCSKGMSAQDKHPIKKNKLVAFVLNLIEFFVSIFKTKKEIVPTNTMADSNFCSGNACFVHRKDLKK